MSDLADLSVMAEAVALAGRGRPHPNPRVGAVLVKNGQIVGRGFHQGPGHKHAEIEALEDFGGIPTGSTMYVTLEPCSHHGRTPPCTDALIAAGVATVVVGELDPDERVSGSGIARLEAAGIEVSVVGFPNGSSPDPGYIHHRRTGRARVTLKAATTLDGQLAAADGTSQWITSEEARAHSHGLRAQADAILVGAGTVLADDPLLTVRLPGYDGPQPRPIIVVGNRSLEGDYRIWDRDPLIVTSSAWDGPGTAIEAPGDDGRVNLRSALGLIADHGYLDVLVEGGATVAGTLWRERLVDGGVFYLAGKVAGGLGMGLFDGTFATLTDARDVVIRNVQRVGPDIAVEFSTEQSD